MNCRSDNGPGYFWRWSWLLLSLLTLAGQGCYESPFPLASSDREGIDARLLGSWIEAAAPRNDTPYRVVIHPFNDHEYLIAFTDSPGGKAILARGFITTMDGVAIINLQGIDSLKPTDRTFLFFKYRITAQGDLETWMIDHDSKLLEGVQLTDQAALYDFVQHHVRDPALYMPVRVFKPAEGVSTNLVLSGPA
jgi:hypothetical protein